MRTAYVKDLEKPLHELNSRISSVLYMVDNYYENIEYDRNDGEEAFLADEFKGVIDKLSVVQSKLAYLQKPVFEESILYKNRSGRYETDSGIYFTSGSVIEVFIYDEFYEMTRWVKSRIEHKNGDYYLFGYDNVNLEGLKVRVRR